MAAPDSQNARPVLARRNTFQKMLDLERKNKVDRMQASPTVAPIPYTRKRSIVKDRNSYLEGHPALLANNERTMSTPPLRVATAPADLTADSSAKKYVIKAGNAVPHNEAESDNESDRSSICHSPGWDDLTGNKKKREKQAAKDKKIAENKKLETEAKHAIRMKNRLNKAPPISHRRFSKLEIAMDRSASSPVILTTAGLSQAPPAKQERPKAGMRSRRSSIDAGLKNLLSAAQGIPSLFAKNSPSMTQSPKTTETPSPLVTSSSNGFIGGLKLRLTEQAQVHEKIRQSASINEGERTSYFDHRTQKEGSRESISHASSGTPAAGDTTVKLQRTENVPSRKPTISSTNDESVRTPQQWDNIYAQAGKMVRDESMAKTPSAVAVADDNWPPIMQSDIRLSEQARESVFTAVPNGTRKRESFGSSGTSGPDSSNPTRSRHTRPRTGEEGPNHSRRGSSPRSLDKKPRNREPSVDSRTSRTSGAHLQNQRLLSKDRGMAAFRDDNGDERSTDLPAEQSSASFHSIRSHTSTDIPLKPSTIDIMSSSDTPEEVANNFAFFSEYTPPALQLDNLSPSSDTPLWTHHHNGSGGLRSFNFAKPTSPESPVPSPSPIANSFVSSIFDTVDSRPTSKRGPTSPAVEGSGLNVRPGKAETMMGEVSTPISAQISPMPNPSDPISPEWRYGGEESLDVGPRKSSGMQHTRNVTDSSEESSTLDEFSNVTTPMASRPHSQKEYFPSVSELNNSKLPKASTSSPKAIRARRVPLMTGAIPYDSDLNGSSESWSRTVLPIDGTDDESHITPKNQSPAGSSASLATHPAIRPDSARLSTTVGPEKESKPADSSASLATHPAIRPDSARLSTTVGPEKESKSASALQRQLSLSRSASTPELQDLSFLPALKHQALTKPPAKKDKGRTAVRKGKQPASSRDPESNEPIKPPPISVPRPSSQGSSPVSPSGYLRDARMSLPSQRPHSKSPRQGLFAGANSSPTQLASPGTTPEPIAKMLVVCCSCKYFHDMPSKIYECMAKPDNVVEDTDLGVSGVVSTSVKCPWCGHGMSTACCAGYAAVVYLRERLH